MYHVYNVIKYLTGDEYYDKDLIDDIEKTFEDCKKGYLNDAIYKFYIALNNFIYQRRNDAITFANVMMSDGYPLEYKTIIEYYALPFRFARNPIAEKILIEKMCDIKDLRLDQAIMGLIGTNNKELFNSNPKFLERMNFFFNFEPISFESIGKSQRIGWIEPMPQDPNQIIYEYINVMNNPRDPKYGKKIGNYGELLFYEYLKSITPNTNHVLWVSKTLGDGFGYDIAVYNPVENKIYLYEVKTTANESSFYDTSLNQFESRICNLLRDYPDHEYHIIKILLGNEIRMLDINDKTTEVSNLYKPDEKYKVLRSPNTELNTYMTVKN